MYASLLDMISRFGADELIQLTNRASIRPSPEMLETLAEGGSMSGYSAEEQAATQAVADAVNESLNDSAGEINPFLQARYALPLASVPAALKRIGCDVARYHLHRDEVSESVRNRYKDGIAFMKSVASGRASLGLDENQAATPATGGVQHTSTDRIFSDENLSSYFR